MAKGKMRGKIPALREALDGHFTDAHARLVDRCCQAMAMAMAVGKAEARRRQKDTTAAWFDLWTRRARSRRAAAPATGSGRRRPRTARAQAPLTGQASWDAA